MIKIIRKKSKILEACYSDSCGSECTPPTCWWLNDPASPVSTYDNRERDWGGGDCWTYDHYLTSDYPQNPKPYVWSVTDPCPEFDNGDYTLDWMNWSPSTEYCADTTTCEGIYNPILGYWTYYTPAEGIDTCGVWAAGLNSGSSSCSDCLDEQTMEQSWSA